MRYAMCAQKWLGFTLQRLYDLIVPRNPAYFRWAVRELLTGHPSPLPEYFYTAGGLATPFLGTEDMFDAQGKALFLSESLCSCCPALLRPALLSTGREGGRMTCSEKQREVIQESQETKACWMLRRRHKGNGILIFKWHTWSKNNMWAFNSSWIQFLI